MKRFALIFSALLLCVGFVVAQSGKGAVISSAAPEFDFGIIKEANGKVSHTFVIKNTGGRSSGDHACRYALRLHDA